MKPDKIRDQDTKELETQLRQMEDQLFHLRFQMGMGQMDGLKKYRAVRKDRARILTILGQRQQQQAGTEAVRKG